MWIDPQEKTALEIIRIQRLELLDRQQREALAAGPQSLPKAA
jgi:hypothetical protein